MKRNFDKKYLYLGVTLFLVFVAGAAFYVAITNLGMIKSVVNFLLSILQPILIGLAIAYLVEPIVKKLEKWLCILLQKKFANREMTAKISRIAAILITLVIVLLVLYGLIRMVIPQLLESIQGIVKSLPVYYNNFQNWLGQVIASDSEFTGYIELVFNKIYQFFNSWLENDLPGQINQMVSGITTSAVSVLSFLINIVIGIIISVYVLFNKTKFLAQAKKITYAVFRTSHANYIVDLMRYTHKVFGGFISGKILDSTIIGILCFVGMSLIGLPFPLLISIIVGVTNVIPFFGPYMGAIPSAILILFVNPMQCLYFVMFIVVLQQIDGNIIGPRILGDATGLSGFWVVVAILLFGGLFGVPGMIMGVPIFAVLYTLIGRAVNGSLGKKGISTRTEDFTDLNHVDLNTGEMVNFDAVTPGEKPGK